MTVFRTGVSIDQMRFLALSGMFCLAAPRLAAGSAASEAWDSLKTKRDALAGVHQEFRITQVSKTARSSQAQKRELAIDMAGGEWRRKSIGGSGNFIRIFDRKDLFLTEEGGVEFVRIKRRKKDDAPAPDPYDLRAWTGGRGRFMRKGRAGSR